MYFIECKRQLFFRDQNSRIADPHYHGKPITPDYAERELRISKNSRLACHSPRIRFFKRNVNEWFGDFARFQISGAQCFPLLM
jgi:hypothetical protein